MRSSQGGGVHGNAILSKHEIVEAWAVEHTCHPVDWDDKNSHPAATREPRHGRRLTLGAKIATPGGRLLAYSAHLEVRCSLAFASCNRAGGSWVIFLNTCR